MESIRRATEAVSSPFVGINGSKTVTLIIADPAVNAKTGESGIARIVGNALMDLVSLVNVVGCLIPMTGAAETARRFLS